MSRSRKCVVWLSIFPCSIVKDFLTFIVLPSRNEVYFFYKIHAWAPLLYKIDVIMMFLSFVCLFVCLFVPPVAPQFIEIPEKIVKVIGNSVASLTCRVSGFPPPIILWSRGLLPLPQGRTTITNDGTLNISKFSPGDASTYQCKATNKLGSVSALTTLNYVQLGEFTMKIVLKTVLISENRQL